MTTTRAIAPSAPGRQIRTEQQRQDFEQQTKNRIAANEKRKELFNALHHFVQASRAGWITSAPGNSPILIQALSDGDLIDQLIDRGFDLQSLGTGERIEGGMIRPVCLYALHLPPLGK